jgi:CSLREA domain-containing protein
VPFIKAADRNQVVFFKFIGRITMNKIIRISIPFMIAFLFISILIWLAGASSLVTATPSLSTTEGAILVTTLDDELNTDGDCSLREAIEAANTNLPVDACGAGDAVITDTITFDVSGTITVTSQLLVTAGGPLVIDGGEVITTSGGGTTRVWWVESGSNLTLKQLSVVDGYINVWDYGAGLFNNGGNLTVSQCEFIDNKGDYGCEGGGIFSQSGIIYVTDSLFRSNGSIYGVTYGGGISINDATGIIRNSTFISNTSSGAIGFPDIYPGGGGINLRNSSIIIQDSSFISNTSDVGGGGIANYYGFLTIKNSTLSGNSGYHGGGICNKGGVITATNSTLSDNSSAYGSITNIFSGTIIVTNSIVANSMLGGACGVGSGIITDGGHNISSDDSCGFDPANGSMPNTDPLLGPLQDNGGPTWTHALLPGSPAIDAGDDTQCPATDQRGVPRPEDGDGDGEAICDIGAYELEAPWVSPTLVTITGPGDGFVGQSYLFTATVEPISTTLPLDYVWQTSGYPPITETIGLTDTFYWAWEMTGTQIITVTASNSAGTVSASHVITVTTPVYETYLPLVTKPVETPLESVPPSSNPERGVLLGLVTVGIIGRWKGEVSYTNLLDYKTVKILIKSD